MPKPIIAILQVMRKDSDSNENRGNHNSGTLLPPACGVGGRGLAVKDEAGSAVNVSGVGADMRGLERLKNFRAGMVIAIVKSA
jgi:hypothetical protein